MRVVNELFLGSIELELASHAIADVRHVAQPCGLEAGFDTGVEVAAVRIIKLLR